MPVFYKYFEWLIGGLIAFALVIFKLTFNVLEPSPLPILLMGIVVPTLAVLFIIIKWKKPTNLLTQKTNTKNGILYYLKPYVITYAVYIFVVFLVSDSRQLDSFLSPSDPITNFVTAPLIFVIPIGFIVNLIRKSAHKRSTAEVSQSQPVPARNRIIQSNIASLRLLYLAGVITALVDLFFVLLWFLGSIFFDDPNARYLDFILMIIWPPLVTSLLFYTALTFYRKGNDRLSILFSTLSVLFIVIGGFMLANYFSHERERRINEEKQRIEMRMGEFGSQVR